MFIFVFLEIVGMKYFFLFLLVCFKILIFNKILELRILGIIFEYGNVCLIGLDIIVLRFYL